MIIDQYTSLQTANFLNFFAEMRIMSPNRAKNEAAS